MDRAPRTPTELHPVEEWEVLVGAHDRTLRGRLRHDVIDLAVHALALPTAVTLSLVVSIVVTPSEAEGDFPGIGTFLLLVGPFWMLAAFLVRRAALRRWRRLRREKA